MYYISKGIPEKGGITAQLRIVTGGQIFTLFGLDETLWLRARFEVVATATPEEEAVRKMLRLGLMEYTSMEDPAALHPTQPLHDRPRQTEQAKCPAPG